MKSPRKFISAFTLFFGLSFPVFAQPPVVTGLKLQLEAGFGFNPNGALAATWTDGSLSGNDMVAASNTTEPTLVSLIPGTSFAGVYFATGANQYMQNSVLNSTFYSTEATLFVVRVANTALSITPNAHTLLSISDDNNFHNEFCMNSDIAMHHTWSGNFCYRDHQCFPSLPDDRPVVLSAVFGTAVNDINYYVNSILSTKALSPAGSPTPYTSLNRRIYVGTRFNSGAPHQFFEGYLLEVLAYNRKLTAAETDSVNDYLRCKYIVDYAACNSLPMPQCDSDTGTTAVPRFDPGIVANTLFQNCPNPFHTSTIIQFNISNFENNAELVITDFTGKQIKRFLLHDKGFGSVTLEALSLSPGNYLCSLLIDGQYVAHKKMMLIE